MVATRRPNPLAAVPSWVRLLRVFATSFDRSGIATVQRIPSGPLDDSLYAEIQEMQRAVETRYFGPDALACEHGRDYTLLLRSIGPAWAVGVRDRSGRLLGLCSLNGLRLRLPDGRTRRVMYVAHLHVRAECRHGIALPALIARSIPPVLLGGAVVIALTRDGGGFTPGRVSRVLGLPAASVAATVRLVTFDARDADIPTGCAIRDATEREVRQRYAAHARGCIASVGGDPSMRSALPPRWLIAADGSACGCIEDYHATTRWVRADGSEFRQSNISFFGWRDPQSAGSFVRACLREARRIGAERVRILLDERLAGPVVREIGVEPTGDFRWSLSAAGLRRMPDAPWVLHPSEI